MFHLHNLLSNRLRGLACLFVHLLIVNLFLPPSRLLSLYSPGCQKPNLLYTLGKRLGDFHYFLSIYFFSVCKLVSSFVCCARFFTLEPREPLHYSSLYPPYLFCCRSNLELWWYAKKYMTFTICFGSGFSYRQPAQCCSIASNIKHRKNHRNKTFRW